MKKIIHQILAHPSTRQLHLDDPSLTDRRRQVLKEKKFLRRIYEEWYQNLVRFIPDHPAPALELGSGAGFFNEYCKDLIQTEIFWIPDLDLVLDGCNLPIKSDSLKSILMIDVLHHISDVKAFFSEATRCLIDGGKIIMLEPWVTPWSSFIYHYLHHEPFNPQASSWDFPSTGPLSGANGALPWIIFERDRTNFKNEFPQFLIERQKVMMPFRYLVSGGVSMRSLTPEWSFGLWRKFEGLLEPWMDQFGMFAMIVLRYSKNNDHQRE